MNKNTGGQVSFNMLLFNMNKNNNFVDILFTIYPFNETAQNGELCCSSLCICLGNGSRSTQSVALS